MRCGHKTFLLGTLLVFMAVPNALAATRYDSIDVPKDITKTGTTISTIEVDEAGPIENLDVELDISFIWDEDLDVYLVAPDGTSVELFTDVGGMGMDFTETVLDDEAATSILDGQAPFTGRYRPEGSLSDLDGKERQGTWRLEITNDGGWFSGTLNSWALVLGGNGGPSCLPPPMPTNPDPADGATGVPINAILSWRLTAGPDAPFRFLATTGEEEPDPFTLFELQTDPAAVVRIGDSCGIYVLDFSPDGELYGCDDYYALWKLAVDGNDVSCTKIGDLHSRTEQNILMTGLAFHPDGTLYGSTFDLVSSTSVLYTIDVKTAYATEVCRFPILQDILWAIEFSPDGELYAAFISLLLVDMDACQTTYLGDVMATDLDWAPDGFLYAIDSETRTLYQMDASLGIVMAEHGPYEIAPWGLASEILYNPQTGPVQTVARASMAADGPKQSDPARDRRILKAEALRLLDRRSRADDADASPPVGSRTVAGQDIPVAANADGDPNRVTYDVFLDVVSPPTALALGDTEAQQYDPGGLDTCVTYYWQVVAKNDCGDTLAGPVWSFTTESVPADFDDDCDVDFGDLAVFASYWLFVPE